MVGYGHVYKAVTEQLAEMDEMDVPTKEWNIFDMAFLSTDEVIARLYESGIPSLEKLAHDLQNIVDCESENDDES
jgi:hypothetical protein